MTKQNQLDKPILPIDIYLGGSFDPIHNGHVAILQHVYQSLRSHCYEDVVNNSYDDSYHGINAYFLPTSRSPLKTASTDPRHRLAMLERVIKTLNFDTLKQEALNQEKIELINQSIHPTIVTDAHISATQPIYHICEEEIWQPPPTYTIDTLNVLRNKTPDTSLIFIVGADNIAHLEKWRDGLQLTQLAHLWVVPRDDWQSQAALYHLLPQSLQSQVTDAIADLKSTTHGRIYIDSKGIVPIASSTIRAAIANNQPNQVKYALPSSVYSYIIENNLYPVT